MGWSFRKSFRIGPGIRLNLSKGGVGVSGGVKGLRIGIGPRGTQLAAGRGGFLYQKKLGGGPAAQDDQAPVSNRLFRALIIVILLLLLIVALLLWYALRGAH